MGYAISSILLARLLADAQNSPDREICGLLFGTPTLIEAATPCTNVSPDPRRAFEIDPAALFAAHRRARSGGPAVIGHYHSHPTGEPIPSPRDAAEAMGDAAVWLILTTREAKAWQTMRPGEFEPVRLAIVPV